MNYFMNNKTLQLKTCTMGFAEMEAFKNLANYAYKKMIEDAEPEDVEGLKTEIDAFNEDIDIMIISRVIDIMADDD